MNRKMFFVLVSLCALAGILSSCEAPTETGFLSSYSKLEPVSDASALRYIGPSLGNYSKFIIDPVTVHFHVGAKGANVDPEIVDEMTNHMYSALVEEISGPYSVVSRPGDDVARIRIAITDINKDTPALNVLPTTKVTGLGLGGAAMEAEVVDSETGEQIAAVVRSQQGKRLSLQGLSSWSSAKAVIDNWAKQFRMRLDEAHGF